MAFLRIDKKKSGNYLRIVRSYRSADGKNRHETICNLGKAEDYSAETLKKMGQALYELGGGTVEELEHRMFHEVASYYYGFVQVVRRLLDTYSLDRFFDGVTRNKSLGFDLTDCVNLLICERLHDPVSKYSNYINQGDYFGLANVKLHQIYRALDQLSENQEAIKQLIYSKGRNLFNQSLDVVYYDVTTFYFNSGKEDGFREKGFGKDGGIGDTIILFGLLIDQNKQPVGYEVYRGKKYEGHTFADSIDRLKKKYRIEKVICVADTGMMNKDNREEVEQAEYEYIFGERLKNLGRGIQNEILDISRYANLSIEDPDSGEKVTIRYYVTGYNGRKLISTYSEKRAAKDKAEREEKIEKAKKFLQDPEKLAKKARAYYIKKEGENSYSLDGEKIKRSERFDGFMTVATNNRELSHGEVLSAYKQLYKIEQAFRSFKTFLETRPMFHWTEKRILGHLSLCYISFTLLNYLQLRLQKLSTPLSENQIRKALVKMQLRLVSQNDKEYYSRSSTTTDAKKIIKALKLKQIPDLTPRETINQYV